MTTLKITDLIIHPKNEFYFDDVVGDKWERLLESIKANGVRTPIIVTDDMRVVSGNQRVRACKKLGISVINAEIIHYQNEDDVVRDLIEINIRQRGVIDDSEVKAGRRLKFLEDYYGVKHGGDRKSKPQNAVLKSQPQLAAELGMSVDKMQRLVKLAEMIPEMQELVETGKVTPTTARAIVKQLSEDEQRTMAKEISGTDVSAKEWQAKYEAEKRKRKEAESREPEIREVKVEVPPADYGTLKKEIREARRDAQRAEQDYESIRKKWMDSQDKVRQLESIVGADKVRKDADRDVRYFTDATNDYIRRYGGHVWVFNEFQNLDETLKRDFIDAIRALDSFAQQIINNLGGGLNE